jgi:hypothetical protein
MEENLKVFLDVSSYRALQFAMMIRAVQAVKDP